MARYEQLTVTELWLGPSGNKHVQMPANAAPTMGTWKQGDVAWYATPTASNPPGAVCVASGSPGTWKAMANLAA